jgi:hypothetical protein
MRNCHSPELATATISARVREPVGPLVGSTQLAPCDLGFAEASPLRVAETATYPRVRGMRPYVWRVNDDVFAESVGLLRALHAPGVQALCSKSQ